VAESLGLRSGLSRKPRDAPQFYLIIIAATLVGMAINFLGINAITALVLSAVLNGLVAPPLLVLVMLVSNDKAVMGRRTNGRLLNGVGWVTTITMSVAAVGLILTTIFE
jgi:Mn2+/Fe2+ NRAMP family transporter